VRCGAFVGMWLQPEPRHFNHAVGGRDFLSNKLRLLSLLGVRHFDLDSKDTSSPFLADGGVGG